MHVLAAETVLLSLSCSSGKLLLINLATTPGTVFGATEVPAWLRFAAQKLRKEARPKSLRSADVGTQ